VEGGQIEYAMRPLGNTLFIGHTPFGSNASEDRQRIRKIQYGTDRNYTVSTCNQTDILCNEHVMGKA